MSHSLSNNINSLNTIVNNNFTIGDDRSNILAWLSPLDPKLRHQNIQDRRVETVGEWLLKTEEFRSWRAGCGGDESDNPALFCYGDPGVGKTFISSLVIDRLCDQAGGRNATVACFYLDFAAQKEHSPTSILGALLKQVVGGLDETPAEISRGYQDQKSAIGGRGPQLANIVRMLQTTASRKPTFICIDALDECVARHRAQLLDSLDQILQKSPSTRIFVTGRPHIQAEVGKSLSGRVTNIRISPRRHDIIYYLHRRLDQDTTPDAMDSSLKADILEKIVQDISEMFLPVSLNVDAILQETTISSRRRKLNIITDGLGLGSVYGEVLSRINGQDREKSRLGISTLMWISHSERPLNTDELCHALGVEIGSPDLDAGNVPSIGTVLGCCQGLVSVDKETSTIRLIHFTLQEYLRAHPELFGTPHSTIAETCLSYLNSRQIRSLPDDLDLGIGTAPSLPPPPRYLSTSSARYSSLRLSSPFGGGSSVHSSAPLLGDSVSYSSTPFLGYSSLRSSSSFGGGSSVQSSAPLLGRSASYSSPQLPGYSSLRSGSSSRVDPSVHSSAPILEYSPSYPSTPFLEYSSLYWGMHAKRDLSDCANKLALKLLDHCGNHIATEILLGQETPRYFDPSLSYISVFSGLHCASFFGIVEIVTFLVEAESFDINQTDWTGSTPLMWAALKGHEQVVEILLGRGDVDPEKPDKDGLAPLWWAARNGHEEVVKILLGRDDVNPDNVNGPGGTPLWCAAKNGHEGVAKILLGRDDVSPDKPNEYGETALWWAAVSGHEEVVKILLGCGEVNPDKPDRDGRTPLWCAAESGHEGVVEVLVGRDDVNPNKPDQLGQTPLSCAAKNGHEGAVRMLLERNDVNPDKGTGSGETPLWYAAKNGHEEVVKILLERDDVNPDKSNADGDTPLWHAADRGREGVVKRLLGRDDVNPDKPNKSGITPLLCAAGNGHEGVVKILLGRDDVSPDKPNEDGETPLSWAAGNGHEGVVKILLGRQDVDPDAQYDRGLTPLQWAVMGNHKAVAALLQQHTASAALSTA